MRYEDISHCVPRIFCWTKMQSESGESLIDILARKEIERIAGKGIFYWGVGNSLGRKAAALLSRDVDTVVFSRMLTMPNAIDVDPGAVFIWLNYRDQNGNIGEVPQHVLLKSRARSKGGIKNRHYALICRSERPLVMGDYGSIDTANYRNYGSSNPRIGDSQVTTILELQRGGNNLSSLGRTYEVNLIAKLTTPYFVTLLNPVVLSTMDTLELKKIFAQFAGTDNYLERISDFRRRVSARAL